MDGVHLARNFTLNIPRLSSARPPSTSGSQTGLSSRNDARSVSAGRESSGEESSESVIVQAPRKLRRVGRARMARSNVAVESSPEEPSSDEMGIHPARARKLTRRAADAMELDGSDDSQRSDGFVGPSGSGDEGEVEEDEEDESGSSEEDMDRTGDFEAEGSPRKIRNRAKKSSYERPVRRRNDHEPTRRSTRATEAPKSYALHDPDSDDEDEADPVDSEDVVIVSPPKTRSRAGRTGMVPSGLRIKLTLTPKPKRAAHDDGDEEMEEDVGRNEEGERYLDVHRGHCGKCGFVWTPDMVEQYKKAARKTPGRPRANNPVSRFEDIEDVYSQGCWIECETCSESFHYGCLHTDLRNEIKRELKARRQDALAKVEALKQDSKNEEAASVEIPPDHMERNPAIRLLHKCNYCHKEGGMRCMICAEGPKQKRSLPTVAAADVAQAQRALSNEPGADLTAPAAAVVGDPVTNATEPIHSEPAPMTVENEETSAADPEEPYLFRCADCHRPAHYSCLPTPHEEADSIPDKALELNEKAHLYQLGRHRCGDCEEWEEYKIECILAWRPSNAGKSVTDAEGLHGEKATTTTVHPLKSPAKKVVVQLPDSKAPFEQAEYLCKFVDHYFGDLVWLPHSYMVAKVPAKLRNFLIKGPGVDLARYGKAEEDGEEPVIAQSDLHFGLAPDPKAESKIPKAWITPDRIVSVAFEDKSGRLRNISEMRESSIPSTADEMYDRITEAYIVWQDMPVEHATWTLKFERDSPYFPAFMAALEHYVRFRKTVVPTKPDTKRIKEDDSKRAKLAFRPLEQQPSFIPHELFPFQLEGVNFCYFNWWRGHSTILADEMGLGKTVQICSFISVLFNQERRMPFLIVVPNSTISNWVRECGKWMPDLKTVALTGTAAAREITERYELFPNRNNELAAHVIVATYQAAEKASAMLNRIGRWEAIIVDEGQRLKSGDKGQLFRVLTSLRAGNRVLMSGTPLNNNLRELFNLLSFIDPENYPKESLDGLEAKYLELTQELIEELRNTIRPYMLRRTKDTALDLPKLTEIIVPVSMRPIQKQIYKAILTRNADIIHDIYSSKSKTKPKKGRAGFQNILMELRKDLGHPYLNDPNIEPSDVSAEEAHKNLVEASGKLVFLQKFLPKLKEKGHRVLIFSQFVIFLDILERFLEGERVRFLRLDGNTSQMDRQSYIDMFNRENSEYDVFMLSTRAGGAGINLASADTVIVADPDWNPHNDLQAISRAHRYGQKKPVNVFKLMCKGSAEEKIVHTGKKKLVLDHLVIQKASEEDTEAADIENILQYGARELFAESDEALSRDIRYTDEEINELLKRTYEESQAARDPENKADKTFAFARVWESSKGLNDLADEGEADVEEQRGFWDRLLQQTTAEAAARRLAEEEMMGRGARKRRAVDYMERNRGDGESPDKKDQTSKKRSGSEADLDEDFDVTKVPEASTDDERMDDELGRSDIDIYEDKALNRRLKEERAAAATLRAQKKEARRLKKLEQLKKAAELAEKKDKATPIPLGHGQAMGGSSMMDLPKYESSSKPNPDAETSKGDLLGTLNPSVRPLVPEDVVGKSAEVRQAARDRMLRDLVKKARGLRNGALDDMLNNVRGLKPEEQTKRMMQALKFAKTLQQERTLQKQRHAAALNAAPPVASTSTNGHPYPGYAFPGHHIGPENGVPRYH